MVRSLQVVFQPPEWRKPAPANTLNSESNEPWAAHRFGFGPPSWQVQFWHKVLERDRIWGRNWSRRWWLRCGGEDRIKGDSEGVRLQEVPVVVAEGGCVARRGWFCCTKSLRGTGSEVTKYVMLSSRTVSIPRIVTGKTPFISVFPMGSIRFSTSLWRQQTANEFVTGHPLVNYSESVSWSTLRLIKSVSQPVLLFLVGTSRLQPTPWILWPVSVDWNW